MANWIIGDALLFTFRTSTTIYNGYEDKVDECSFGMSDYHLGAPLVIGFDPDSVSEWIGNLPAPNQHITVFFKIAAGKEVMGPRI